MASGTSTDETDLDQPAVTPAAERLWSPFSPTSQFSFVHDGGPGRPEFFEERSRRGDGPPLHRHPWPTWELVLGGTIRVVVDGVEHRAGAGDVVFTPPDAVHTYVVESDEAHVVGMGLSEGRFARLQHEAAPLLMADGGPDLEAVGRLAASLDVDVMGPPLSPT